MVRERITIFAYSVSLDQVKAGNLSASYIDETVKTVLRTKFALGLFESTWRTMHSYYAYMNNAARSLSI